MIKPNLKQYAQALFLAAVVFMIGVSSASAQQASEKATRLALGAVSGGAKSQVMVPLFLTPYPPEAQVGDISADVVYPSKGFTFLRAEKSFLLDGVGGSFQAKAEPDAKDPNKSAIHLEVTTKGEPRKGFREGLILTLVFRIEPDAAVGKTVTLDLEKFTATNIENKPMQPLVSKKGTIQVVSPEGLPYVGCFFFSH